VVPLFQKLTAQKWEDYLARADSQSERPQAAAAS
jgi:hypothetical protein